MIFSQIPSIVNNIDLRYKNEIKKNVRKLPRQEIMDWAPLGW